MFARDRDPFRGNDDQDLGMEMDEDTGTTVTRRRTGKTKRAGASRPKGAKKASGSNTRSRKRK